MEAILLVSVGLNALGELGIDDTTSVESGIATHCPLLDTAASSSATETSPPLSLQPQESLSLAAFRRAITLTRQNSESSDAETFVWGWLCGEPQPFERIASTAPIASLAPLADGAHAVATARAGSLHIGRWKPLCGKNHATTRTVTLQRTKQLSLPVSVSHVAVGASHAIALDSAGCLYAWGHNRHGCCGVQTVPADAVIAAPTRISQTRFVDVAAGWYHTAALDAADGAVFTWGFGQYGALGHGEMCSEVAPKRVQAISPPPGAPSTVHCVARGRRVVCGAWHTMLITSFGELYAWGWNAYWQLGLPRNTTTGPAGLPDDMSSYEAPDTDITSRYVSLSESTGPVESIPRRVQMPKGDEVDIRSVRDISVARA